MIETIERKWPKTAAVEVPTLLLIMATYGGWLTITLGLQPLATCPRRAHRRSAGHSPRFIAARDRARPSDTLAGGQSAAGDGAAVTVAARIVRYRQTHLQHHRDDRLTDPLDDPESYLLDA